MGQQLAQPEVFACSSLETDDSNGIESTDAHNVEAHVEGHVEVDGKPHDNEVVENVAIGSKNVKGWPPVHPFVYKEWC